jgi:hypothetical protein
MTYKNGEELIKAVFFLTIFFLSLNPLMAQTANTVTAVAKENHFEYWSPDPSKNLSLTLPRKKLLEAGLKWAAQNISCDQVTGTHTPFNISAGKYLPVMGPCSSLEKIEFGDFDGLGSDEMIIGVSGGSDSGAHGYNYTDAKYILCRFSESGFSADMFEENKTWNGLSFLKFPNGPEMVWIEDVRPEPIVDTPPSQARLYLEINGKLKNVLTYDYLDSAWQIPDGFETRLIPEANRDIWILKQTTKRNVDSDGNTPDPITTFTETLYRWDSTAGVYATDGIEKPVPAGDWDKAVSGTFKFWN